jgi:WD40 repeat protein
VAVGFLSGGVQVRSVPDGRLLATLQHVGKIQALAFSADGKRLAVGGASARVWDAERKAFLDPVWRHPQPVCALAFDRRAERLITAGEDKLVRVFAVASAKEQTEPLYAPLAHAPELPSPPALVDGDRTLVTISGKQRLTRWELATGKPSAAPIPTRPWALQGVVASPDGSWFATGGYNGPEVHATDVKRPSVHMGHTNLVHSLAFSPDSRLLLSASWDGTARLWSLPDGRPLGPPLAHMGKVERCAWSGDARFIATAQGDGLIRVWRRPGDALVKNQASAWGERPRVSFDGQFVTPGLWHEGPMAYSHQGLSRLRVLKTGSGEPAGAAIGLPGQLVDSCVCGDNRSVAAVCTRGGQGLLGVWEIATAKPLGQVQLPGLALSVAARPGSPEVAVLCTTGDLQVIDSWTGRAVFQTRQDGWRWDGDRQPQVQYTPDGRTLVSLSSGQGTPLHVRDADTGALRFPPLNPLAPNGVHCRSFSLAADSRLLATIVNGKNAAQVWDLATGRALSQPLPHPGDYHGLFFACFSPDGQHLLTGCRDGQVRCWDWQAGKLVCPPLAHANEVFDVAFTPDGRCALTTLREAAQLHLWDLTTGRRIAPPIRLAAAENASTHTLAVTPDGRRALVCFKPADVAVLDLEALLSPGPTPPADLALLAELTTAQRIEVGDLSGLTTEQWQERWDRLRERNPGLARAAVTESRPTGAAASQRARAAAGAFARGEEFARRGQWAQAAAEALAEVAADPGERMLWLKAAPRLLLAGDGDGYRRLCAGMIERFRGTTDLFEADVLCKTCLLRAGGADRAHLPSRVLIDEVEQARALPQFHGYFLACLALLAYRDGKFEQAADYCVKSQKVNNRLGPDGALALLVQAMTQHHANKADLASRSLAEATALIPHELATLGSTGFRGALPVSAGIIGHDWLIAELLRREAGVLIRKDIRRP